MRFGLAVCGGVDMKELWKRWRERLYTDHRGFTLVELICTVAIFSIVVTGMGSAMVISARSYRNSNVELDLQQQAQITSNLLTNLILDADNIEIITEDGIDKLKVIKKEASGEVTYVVYQSGNAIYYIKDTSDPEILAENIIDFSISKPADGNVDFHLTIKEGDRSYESDYHVTPRNGISDVTGESVGVAASIYAEDKVILEPGESYELNVRVTGTSDKGFLIDETTFTGATASAKPVSDVANGCVRINVSPDEKADSFSFSIKASDPAITEPVRVTVYIRRVSSVSVSGYKTSGNVNKAGAVYKITANLAGTNLEKEPGAWYDVDYVNPYTATWSYAYTEDSGLGVTSLNFDDHFEVIEQGVEGNSPYIKIRLKNNITEGRKLVVTCTALHPEGTDGTNDTNKSGLKYDTVTGIWELEYQAWRRDGRLDIGLALDDSYFWPGTTPKSFMGTAELTIKGFASNGLQVDGEAGFNFFNTTDSGAFVKVEPGYGDVNTWTMVLDTERARGDTMAYSSPYFSYGNEWTGFWSDLVRYDITVWYRVEYGPHAGEEITLESSHTIEDVQIKFKNAANADWNRTNKVYVTRADSITDYRVYFMFDKGWEGTDYRFTDLNRFVGVVHEDEDDRLDIRRDITPVEQASVDGNYYITFSISDADKEECMAVASGDGGIIKEIYEYNPYFGKLTAYEEWDGSIRFNCPSDSTHQLTCEELASVKGCAGAVEFHFVEPNITGTTVPKVMYCPTVAEYGTVYYIDDTSRFLISDTAAQYQEQSGGVWSTTVNLTWNGSGWTAN